MLLKTYKIPNTVENEHKPKAVWVVCTSEANNSEHVSFLEKILAAVKVDLQGQTAFIIYNENEPKFAVTDAIAQNEPTKIIFFGVVPQQFGLNIEIEPYQIESFRNLQVLWSENLISLQGDKNKKMQLWTALQKLFT